MRPEFTAGIARAFLSEGWQQHAPLKVATHGPAFRYERPQKGRFRQFHQLDVEIIGAADPAADVELLCFADRLLTDLGLRHRVSLQLNTLGDAATRESWRAAVIYACGMFHDKISEKNRERIEVNPLRILDSKEPSDLEIVRGIPDVDSFLTPPAREYFAHVTEGLDAAGVKWERNARLVRGLDYYRHTIFEFVTDELGAQGAVIAGGRYDGLIEALGGPHTPAVGWAAGIERLAMMIDAPEPERAELAIIPRDQSGVRLGSELVALFRVNDIAAEMTYAGSEKRRFEKAKKAGTTRLINIDIDDTSDGIAVLTIRDLNVTPTSRPVRKRVTDALNTRFVVESPRDGRLIQLVARK
jgi:histidyl-tRNA synthetase